MQEKKCSKAQKNLQEWLTANNLPKNRLANMIESQYSQIWKWMKGEANPGLKSAVLIEDITGGKVKCRDWFEETSQTASKPRNKLSPKVTKNSESQHAKKHNKDRAKVKTGRSK